MDFVTEEAPCYTLKEKTFHIIYEAPSPIDTKDLESNQLRIKHGQLNVVKSLIKAIPSF